MEGQVDIEGGRVRGRRRGELWVFSGLPYAKAPVGELRWRPPQPVASWTGVRQAEEFGPIAPQNPPVPGFATPADIGEGDPQSEDCLSLNVWTSALAGEVGVEGTSGKGRPVMVWIHGGGFTSGSGSIFLYRGSELARRGEVVVVTLNYRLGALGFLSHPGLTTSDVSGDAVPAGNWGLMDQVAAFNWVKNNIATFGGNPDNVTVFGESAGAMSISALLGAPSASGLFHRAIVQSGPAYFHTPEQAKRSAEILCAELGVKNISRESLLHVPPAELVSATQVLAGRPPEPGVLPLPLLPVVDGKFLPRDPLQSLANGSAKDVSLLVGTNRDELSLFAFGNPKLSNMDEERLENWIRLSAPGLRPQEVIQTYRSVRMDRHEATDFNALWVALGSDWVFRWPSLRMAAAQRIHQPSTFAYLFTSETPFFGGILGSCHALEIPFVFGMVRKPVVTAFTGSGPQVERLSDEMLHSWASFAHRGNPSHLGVGEWPAWDPERQATMVFGPERDSMRTSRIANAPRGAELAIYEGARPLFAGVS